MRTIETINKPSRRDFLKIAGLAGIALLQATASLAAEPSTPKNDFTFESRDGALAISCGGQRVADYFYRDDRILRPYFAQLHAPGGIQVTRNHPPRPGQDATDHDTMHPGLWLAFGDISGHDFWRNRAVIKHERFLEPPAVRDGRLTFATENRLQTTNGQTLGMQVSRIVLTARPEGYLLIWDATFEANEQDIVFGDQEEMGLGVRVATAITEKNGGVILGSTGAKSAQATWGKAFDWCDYSGVVGDRRVGVTIMPDPANFRASWFHNRDYGLMVANPFGRKAMKQGELSRVEVKKDARLRLCFGVLLHASPKDQDLDLPGAYQQFLELKRIGLAGGRFEAGPVDFARPIPTHFQVRPLPGHLAFVFTIYGVPGELESLKQLVQVMREQQLGNGFDPGPTPHRNTASIFDYLAGVGWPVICYPGCADMQVQGGRCVLGPENEAALSALDRADVFSAVQLGEWGYYFHNLSPNERWWRDVYGPEFDTFKHLMKPPGLAGYDRHPASRRECYDAVRAYFTSRSRDLLGRVISVTGHSHYEAYAGEWGARCIGLELGENIAFTQSKLAFARGASRQWRLPWSVQVSPWFSGACTTSGPLRTEGGGARGLDAGHSLSFYERMWLHAWFAGAAMVTPENSLAIFFEKAAAPWTFTAHGRKAVEVFEFMRSRERGVPFTPVAIVLDHLAGYNGYMDRPWGILEPTAGDRQIRDLFDHQLFPGSDHIHHKPNPDNPESSYLRPTPYGEMFDVQLTSASAEMLATYPVLLLAGDIEFDDTLVAKLERALNQGSTVLLVPAHQETLGPRFARLAKHPGLEVLQPWTNPATGRPAAISNPRLQRLALEALPIEVSGDPIQYQINRTLRGWVIEVINNAGVAKKPDQPATTDPSAIARVVINPRIRWDSAREWRSNRSYPQPGEIQVEIGPGQSAFVELVCP